MYGADVVIETEGWYENEDDGGFNGGFFGGGGFQSSPTIQIQDSEFSVNPERILTNDFRNTLLSIEGIERVSTVIASPFHLTQIYSEEGKEFTAEIGDYAGLTTIEVSLIGVDQEYSSTIKTQYIEFTQGDLSHSFDRLFETEEVFTCIISESISSNLNLFIDDIIRMVVQRGDESEIYTFKIVGVAASMPGFFNEFGRSGASASMGGVMISQETYISIMDIPPIPYLDKIFIKVSSSGLSQIGDIILYLEEQNRRDFDFNIINLRETAGTQQSYFTILDTFFSMTLDATIVICLFGLISSSYSTIIERKKEIGIIRTLGLKGKEINRLFTIESLIIMLSSGSVGVIVGWCTGLSSQRLTKSTSISFIKYDNCVFGFYYFYIDWYEIIIEKIS
jgi:ABC-type lipoprotein release transport system permease subunit